MSENTIIRGDPVIAFMVAPDNIHGKVRLLHTGLNHCSLGRNH